LPTIGFFPIGKHLENSLVDGFLEFHITCPSPVVAALSLWDCAGWEINDEVRLFCQNTPGH
jgi:hypothetical protein